MRACGVLLVWGLLASGGARAEGASVRLYHSQHLRLNAASILTWEASHSRADALSGVLLQPAPAYGARGDEGRKPGARNFLFSLNRSRLALLLRPGYSEGLPIPEEVARLDGELAFQPNGRINLGAGSLSWLQVEVESFRVATGARRYRFIALPGLVLRPFTGVPVQVGVSVFFAYKRTPDAYSDERRRALGFLQLSGRL